jgi:phosphate/sulfate permease
VVNWDKTSDVVTGIIVSILVAGVGAYLIQRMVRGAMREDPQNREQVLLHGPWIAGGMLTFLTWFLVFKGLKNIAAVAWLKDHTFGVYGEPTVLIFGWAVFTLAVHLFLVFAGAKGTRHLFNGMAVLGMVCMAFAFGQNDLANAASPGLSAWALFLCGALLGGGMLTTYAQRVTRAGVNMGSQFDHVALYAPGWCRAIARGILKMDPRRLRVLAPPPETTDTGKKIHFDALRAAVIMSVAASVIAYASGHGLPVSTTYVSFSAVIGSGIADRVFHRGDSDLKLGRFIWVVFGWLAAPAIAVVATGLIALLLFHLEIVGLAAALAVNIAARFVLKRTSDAHEKRHHGSGPMDDDDAPAPAPA